MSFHTSAVLKEFIDELFDANEVFLVEGDVGVVTFVKTTFNHIFFTGSPQLVVW